MHTFGVGVGSVTFVTLTDYLPKGGVRMPGIITTDDWISRLAPSAKEAMEIRMTTLAVQVVPNLRTLATRRTQSTV
jgi:hypothetical protein